MRHRRFGDGEVVRCEGEEITVAFVRAGERKVQAAYLERADRAAVEPAHASPPPLEG